MILPDLTSGFASLASSQALSASTSSAGLSCRSPLNAACRTLPPSVQPANSISATSSGFSQCTSRVFFGASLPPNGLLSGARRLQRRHDAADGVLPEAGADQADKGEMVAAMDARHQRAEFPVGGLPAADHDLMPGPALGLGPAFRAAGAIGRVELLGDDAFERQFAGRLQDGIAAGLEMLDIADQLVACPCAASSSCLQARLALAQRQRRRSSPPANSRSKAKKIRSSVLPSDNRRLQRREIRRAVVIERDDLAVDQAHRAATSPPWRSRRTCRSSPAPCGSSARPRRPRPATARDSRRT